MPSALVTVVVPTLARDDRLLACLESLGRQTLRDVEVVVVDNSGQAAIPRMGVARFRFRLIENRENLGFGAAVNQGYRLVKAKYLATLNDDAVAHPEWLARMVDTLERDPGAGMAAPRILLAGRGLVDSAGMLLARDGSSKQRGHMEPPDRFETPDEVLCPSGCAGLYRYEMLEQTGLFDEDFFLYCEDTDLGLRCRWAGWRCVYVPGAIVEHAYSASSGAASELKAWLVERNRLRVAVKCLPASWLVFNPFWSVLRYAWHLVAMAGGRGKTADYRESGGRVSDLVRVTLKAYVDLWRNWPGLKRSRRDVFARRRLSQAEFAALLRRHSISLRQVASL